MIRQLLIGAVVIAITIAIQAEMFNVLSRHFEDIVRSSRRFFRRFANTGAIIIGVLYIQFVNTILVWIWASVFWLTGAVPEFEPALYFSLVSFTTVGFGDITLGHEWRLLSGLTAASGFLSFGWSAAYMVELVRKTA
jgi:hypothetical protein